MPMSATFVTAARAGAANDIPAIRADPPSAAIFLNCIFSFSIGCFLFSHFSCDVSARLFTQFGANCAASMKRSREQEPCSYMAVPPRPVPTLPTRNRIEHFERQQSARVVAVHCRFARSAKVCWRPPADATHLLTDTHFHARRGTN